MERALKNLLCVYPILRNWTALSNYTMPPQALQNVMQMYSRHLTDYTPKEYTKLRMRKNMFNDIKEIHDPMKILDTVAMKYIDMSVDDTLDTMSILFRVCKEQHVKDIHRIGKHVGFTRLCEVIRKDIRLMKINDIIESLKIITYFKIPSDTLLIQSLLQVIRTTVNEISLRDIIFVHFLLKKMDGSPLRDALLIALPLIFETQLPTKLDPDDVHLLRSSLFFMNKTNINNPELYGIVIESLRKYEDLDIETAGSVLCSLYRMAHLPPIALQLLSTIQNITTTKAKELDVQRILWILNVVTYAVTNNKEYEAILYNEAMIDAFVNSAISSNITFNDGIQLLRLLNMLNHTHMPFLEYLAAKCFKMPDLLKDASYYDMYNFLEGFVNADYKPVFWDTIRDAILANKIGTRHRGKSLLIKFALHLTALDCYNPDLISKAISEYMASNKHVRNTCATELLLLYQAVKTLYPMYDGPWPSQDILEHTTAFRSTSSVCSFRAALERALGGSRYLYNDVRTKLGHYIDHVVVMRKGGYPVAINTESSNITDPVYIEDIRTPIESQMILIFNLPDSAYAVNSQRVKSTWLLEIRSAEALIKSNTIAINSSSWMKLPEYERVPYLMQAIKLKCEDSSVFVN